MAHQSTSDILRATLDLLVLKTLAPEAMHGWGISQRIQQLSAGAREVHHGSLYPALQRLEHQGLIRGEWQVSENNRRAKYYRLTPVGRRALNEETDSWRAHVRAIELVLGTV